MRPAAACVPEHPACDIASVRIRVILRPPRLEAIKHKDARVKIPTQELRGFVATDEAAPPKLFYSRDASLDRQLVWKGKDEQDAAALEVPVVPVYIQEKTHPQVIVENLERGCRMRTPSHQDRGG
jgi:adenine-specific DNA-methyltransferase